MDPTKSKKKKKGTKWSQKHYVTNPEMQNPKERDKEKNGFLPEMFGPN